jgi:hypothetical protein
VKTWFQSLLSNFNLHRYTMLMVTDGNGCSLAEVPIAAKSAEYSAPITTLRQFRVLANTGAQYSYDKATVGASPSHPYSRTTFVSSSSHPPSSSSSSSASD